MTSTTHYTELDGKVKGIKDITGMSISKLYDFARERYSQADLARLYVCVLTNGKDTKAWLVDDLSQVPQKDQRPSKRPWRWRE